MPKNTKNQGYTLIELLIVITIISILAGVLLSVIDTKFVIGAAKDATTKAAMNKMALAVESFNSSFGRLPKTTAYCNCDQPEKCEFLNQLNDAAVKCHRVQYDSGGYKLWVEVNRIKVGDVVFPGLDLDDSAAIRYHDWQDGCIAAISNAAYPLVFVWTHTRGYMECNPGPGTHPGRTVCFNIHRDDFVKQYCKKP